MQYEGDNGRLEVRNGACPCPDCRLPPQGPLAWLRGKAAPIWCGTYCAQLAKEMGQDAAEECEEAFACGFEKGVIMALLRPEWAQGFYLKIRDYYLLTHEPMDFVVGEEEAAETCRAVPLKAEVSPEEE